MKSMTTETEMFMGKTPPSKLERIGLTAVAWMNKVDDMYESETMRALDETARLTAEAEVLYRLLEELVYEYNNPEEESGSSMEHMLILPKDEDA